MPSNETPRNPRLPEDEGSAPVAVVDAAAEENAAPESSAPSPSSGYSSSRYIDYDTHELLEKIAEYEDERRWQRIREGIWISLLLHFLLFSGLTWIPRYVFHRPQLIDPFDAIKQRKDLTYLDQLPDAVKQVQKLKKPPVLKPNESHVDKKTLEQLKSLEKARPKPTPPAPPPPAPEVKQPQQQTPPPVETPKQEAPPPAPTVSAPQPAPQEAPRPAPVPARPNFALNPQSPTQQLRDAMRGQDHPNTMSGPNLPRLPGTGSGVQILSDTQGVDFGPYLQKVLAETYRTWIPLIPEEVKPPLYKKGQVEIVFTILPNGRLEPHAMALTGRSGDVALDRAAWGSIEGADYPPLPSEFHGPYLKLAIHFIYNGN